MDSSVIIFFFFSIVHIILIKKTDSFTNSRTLWNTFHPKIDKIGLKGWRRNFWSSLFGKVSKNKTDNLLKLLSESSKADTVRIINPNIIQRDTEPGIIRFVLQANMTTPLEKFSSVNILMSDQISIQSIQIELSLIRLNGSKQFWKQHRVMKSNEIKKLKNHQQQMFRLNPEDINEWQESYLPVGKSLSVKIICRHGSSQNTLSEFFSLRSTRVAVLSTSPSIFLNEINHKVHLNLLTRARRSIQTNDPSHSNYFKKDGILSTCKAHSYTINLDVLNWSPHIIHPRRFRINYCQGGCRTLSFNFEKTTNHALLFRYLKLIRPQKMEDKDKGACCTPMEYEDMPVLLSIRNNIVLKVFPNMIVKSCGCH